MVSQLLPRYFFHVRSSAVALDDRDGLNYFTYDSAVLYAKRLAGNIAESGDRYDGFRVILSDDQGRELLNIPVAPIKQKNKSATSR